VLQATGFEDVLPTEEGLFSIRTIEEAVDAIRAIRADCGHHSRAARELAHEHLDASVVPGRLLAHRAVSMSFRQ
jgi:hypothetical protein